MFSVVCASPLLALVFGVLAVEFPPVQSLMLVGACFAATLFFCALEAWSCQDAPALERPRSPDVSRRRDPGPDKPN